MDMPHLSQNTQNIDNSVRMRQSTNNEIHSNTSNPTVVEETSESARTPEPRPFNNPWVSRNRSRSRSLNSDEESQRNQRTYPSLQRKYKDKRDFYKERANTSFEEQNTFSNTANGKFQLKLKEKKVLDIVNNKRPFLKESSRESISKFVNGWQNYNRILEANSVKKVY
eukprot:snap_masked-scaffold_88-processed-gene-0.22-mRNA-1 protein AED:1.00 eAED:1.00 QI:0/-1/0/0/-1/1/1/0/167